MQATLFFGLGHLCRLFAVITLMTSLSTTYAQNSFSKDDVKCYVVVGAFKLENNAKRYSTYLSSQDLNTNYKKNSHRNLYYVYSFDSDNREETKKNLFKLRDQHPELSDSWLYAGNFKSPHIPSDDWEAYMAPPLNESRSIVQAEATEETENTEKVNQNITTTAEESKPESVEPEPIPVQAQVEPAIVLKENESMIYINAYNAASHKEVVGGFKLFDAERDKEIKELKSHELSVINHPSNATNKVKIISNIFGFREIEHVLDLDEPLTDSKGIVEQLGDTILLNFDMLRFNKGDIMTLWQVYFYKDAAIMKEESIGELYQLLGLMKENEDLKIKIHGHTNGNSHGKVLHLDLDDKSFFSLNGSHHETTASAKQLSLFRAYTIQHWLMDQGITEDRMKIQGWGGKKMIYDKHDSQAHKNVRVEIEILEE